MYLYKHYSIYVVGYITYVFTLFYNLVKASRSNTEILRKFLTVYRYVRTVKMKRCFKVYHIHIVCGYGSEMTSREVVNFQHPHSVEMHIIIKKDISERNNVIKLHGSLILSCILIIVK